MSRPRRRLPPWLIILYVIPWFIPVLLSAVVGATGETKIPWEYLGLGTLIVLWLLMISGVFDRRAVVKQRRREI